MKTLRIVFCILSCLSLGLSIALGVAFGLLWFLILALLAAVFAALMLLAKRKSDPAPPAKPDFMNSDEQNAAIRSQNRSDDGTP